MPPTTSTTTTSSKSWRSLFRATFSFIPRRRRHPPRRRRHRQDDLILRRDLLGHLPRAIVGSVSTLSSAAVTTTTTTTTASALQQDTVLRLSVCLSVRLFVLLLIESLSFEWMEESDDDKYLVGKFCFVLCLKLKQNDSGKERKKKRKKGRTENWVTFV